MWKKISLVILVIFIFTGISRGFADTQIPDIEVFDITKGQVVSKIPNTVEVQKEVQLCLESITGVAQPLKETPKEGKMIRIPLNPPILVENQLFAVMSHEVFLILLPSKKPFLIVFGEDHTPHLADFSHNLDKLFNYIKIDQ
jgi:hypothetical protein